MGFLNPVADDDYRIANMPGTSELPAPSAFEGVLTAIPEGIASGAAKLSGLLTANPEVPDYQFALKPGAVVEPQVLGAPEMRAKMEAATKVAADWGATGQDPRKTGVVGRIASGVSEGLTIGGAGAAVGGPWGAAALLGATEGHATYQDALAQKESPEAAKEQAILSGAFSAAGALLPMKFGSSAITSILGGAAANVGLGAAQRGLTSQVLADNGYPQMAAQQRVFDGESMAADLILGGAFGAMGHFLVHDPSRINPADVDAASAVATEDHFNHSAPGVPTDPSVANLHVQTMTDALNKLADGDLPDVQPDVAQKIVDGVIPDPTQEMAAPVPPEYEYLDTRGNQRFHGTSQAMPGDLPNNEYAMSGDNRNIFGQGFYTTDAVDVAHGYMTKGRGGEPTLYQVKERPGTKLYDMESPLTPEIKDIAKGVFGDLLPVEDVDGKPITNLREMYNEFRAESSYNGLSRDDVQEIFDSFRYELERKGYNGFRHTGAIGSKKYQPHEVRIYWTPEDHVDVNRASISDFRKVKTPEKPSPLHEAALEDLPGYDAAAAEIPRMELPPEEPAPVREEPPEPVAGESAPTPDVPLDPYHAEMLDHLVHNYGDATYTTDDGREVTFKQMADELQQQRNEADSFGKLHEIAAACAARNGG